MRDIGAWLEEIGLGEHRTLFAENHIDWDVLAELGPDDLRELQLPLGHQKRLLRAIASLDDHEGPKAPIVETPVGPAPATTHEADRRQITVMFCDLVGSTKLAEQLDPEDLSTLLRAYQTTCAKVVERLDGHVAQYLGDGLMVYFGWPRAHEEDAERAILAASEIVDAAKTVDTSIDLAVRVGIATGRVVVGDTGAGGAFEPKLAVGETPNLAARLQALAGPDEIVIASSTRRLSSGVFEYDDLGEHTLKGILEPVRAWRVTGAGHIEGRFDQRAARGLTPLRGRDSEVDLLVERWQQAKAGDGQAVLIEGEPGIGKSRLVSELSTRIAAEPHAVIRFQCSPYHANSPLHPVNRYFAAAAGIERDDAPDRKLDKLESLLSRDGLSATEELPLFASALSIPTGDRYPAQGLSPQRLKEKALAAIAACFGAMATRHPILIVFEDLQWIDPTTLELTTLAIQQLQDKRVLIVASNRPDIEIPWRAYPQVTTISLNRLNRRRAGEMLSAISHGQSLPDSVIEQILIKTDGVPLFVEELTRTVLDGGLLEARADANEAGHPAPHLAIPSTLRDSLMARLDRLSPVREIVQIGACIGREFSHNLLSEVSPLTGAQLDAAVAQLAASDLVISRGFPPDASYTFKHSLVQDAAYQSLLNERRRHIHQRIAAALEAREAGRESVEPETLARHFFEAGLLDKAAAYWQAAGDRAAERCAFAEATDHYRRGLTALRGLPASSDRDRRELTMLASLGVPLMASRGHGAEEVAKVYSQARDLCRKVGDTPALFPVLSGLWRFYAVRADYDASQEVAEEMVSVASNTRDNALKIDAHRALGATLFWQGQMEDARGHLTRCLDLFEPAGARPDRLLYSHDTSVACLSFAAMALWVLGYPDQALARSDEAVSLARNLDDPYRLAFALNHAAIVYQLRRDAEATLRCADELGALAAEQNYPLFRATASFQRGWALSELGALGDGLEQMRDGLEAYAATGAELGRPYQATLRAEAWGRDGDAAGALSALTQVVSDIEKSKERFWEAELHRLIGRFQLQTGDRALAEQNFRHANDTAKAQGARSWQLRAANSLAWHLIEQGEKQAAHDLVTPIYDWFTEGFETADLKETRTIMEEIVV